MKKSKKKLKFNSDKAFRNFAIVMGVVTISIVITKIATNGIGFLSTIGYFGQEEIIMKINVMNKSIEEVARLVEELQEKGIDLNEIEFEL